MCRQIDCYSTIVATFEQFLIRRYTVMHSKVLIIELKGKKILFISNWG